MFTIKKALLFLVPLVLFFIVSEAQDNQKYDTLWKKVDALYTKKGLTQSALTEVNKIYAMAKKEGRDAQVIKALLYQISLSESVEEDATLKSIGNIEKEIKTSSEQVSSILSSILAENYLSYFQQHRWQLYNRTQTINFKKDDIANWSINDFHSKITSLYLASLNNKSLLQQTKLAPYDAIIVKGNARYLRPTLYDLLAHRALGYFSTDEMDITRPAYAFEIKDGRLFSPASLYSKLNITSSDSLSLHHKALLIYQDLLTLHANDTRPDALIDADILRVKFVHQYGVMENKDSLYKNALEEIISKYPQEPGGTQAYWLLAQWHADKAAQYDPLRDTTYRYEYLTAINICEKVIQQKENSEGKTNCLSLLANIRHRALNLQTEKVNIPNQPFRALITYRNFNQLFLRVIPLTDELKKQLANRYDDNYWKQVTLMKPTSNWSQSLPATNDYQKHNVEIKIGALPVGAYLLLVSADDKFSLNKNPLAVQYFYVSNISYINNGDEYFVLEREAGKPLPKADVQVWIEKYDYNSRQNALIKLENKITDQNGYFKLATQKERRANNFRLEITYKNDRLFLEDIQYTYYRDAGDVPDNTVTASAYEKQRARLFFFTDRSVYRPGQTIHFKGIAITRDFETKKTKVHANYTSTVKLFNANQELVDSMLVTTNEFGSYSGRFQSPENILNGEFRIRDENLNGETSFSVEEYKRPKFYVEYEKLKGSFKLNDSIQISGFAKAYAGNNIGGASVAYRVVREARFIYRWLYWKWGIPRGSNMEITNGIATTNEDGKFLIRFKAIPDLTIDKRFDPVFDYKVIATITDINGETRSGEIIIPVSFKALQLNVTMPSEEAMPADSLISIQVSTKNLTGEFEPALVHLTIHRLQVPERLIRKRYWQQPDQFVMTKEEYLKFFPYDEFEKESEYRTWSKEEKLYEANDSTKANSKFDIRNTRFKEGWYVVEATTKDKFGNEVKDMQYFQLYDEKSKGLPSPQYLWSSQKNAVVQPGNTSSIAVGSSGSDLFVIQEIDKNLPAENSIYEERTATGKDETATYKFFTLNNEKKSFDFPVTENERGGFGVFHFFVKNNRVYVLSHQVNVPWTNKQLTISYESFRDKTLPGSGEKWKLKISGYKNEKVAAEMLASMYDASLDQFKPNDWSTPNIWPLYNVGEKWNGNSNFIAAQSQEKYADEDYRQGFSKIYDRIIALGNPRNLLRREAFRNKEGDVSNEMLAARAPGALADAQLEEVNFTTQNKLKSQQVARDEETKTPEQPRQIDQPLQIRRNFNETAFFFPDLKTNAAGDIEFSFTVPEALTRWKFQALAYTKDAAFGYSSKEMITQKQLMVQPNAPRFLREGDKMELSTKIVNITDKDITGTVQLELLNAITMQPVDGWFQNMTANQYFTAEAGKSIAAKFSIQVPYQFNSAIIYRFIAKAPLSKEKGSAEVSDAEESSLPVLTNSMLVTESMPLPLRGNTTKNFRFEKLSQAPLSETMKHHSLTVEFTSNPAWYAVQALPYLAENSFECSEQIFNRFYANALAGKIANSSPRLKTIFEKWAKADSSSGVSLRSNLEKNPELKAVLLQETPWVLDAKNEAQQKKNIALLFDMMRMAKESESAIEKLKQFQSPNGGFVWFKGGPDDRFITQYILTGIGRLIKLDALPASSRVKLNAIITAAVSYLDKRLKEDYDNLFKNKYIIKNNNLGYLQVQYGYMRSFFKDIEIPQQSTNAVNYYQKQSRQFWLQQNSYMQGMIALALSRSGDVKTAGDILKSLQQNALVSEEMGMYWKENKRGYYWYQAPVETQSLLIEAFGEIRKDNTIVDNLKTWLLKQKQTHNWRTSKATADACYALLLRGNDWLIADPVVEIKLGEKIIKSTDENQEAGTGYFKKVFDSPFINSSMGEISVKVSPLSTPLPGGAVKTNNASTWGAVYWQYFENLDKITSAASPLKLAKKLFVEKNSDRGLVLQPVNENDIIKVGDKVKVRIELSVDRDMEYVHMKDMRAASMEPVNVLSEYKWQGGLGYYESTKDASTNFFFNWLPRGFYVFEYPLFVTHTGNYSNGITSVQCMYAPEFSSHSEGVRVNVE